MVSFRETKVVSRFDLVTFFETKVVSSRLFQIWVLFFFVTWFQAPKTAVFWPKFTIRMVSFIPFVNLRSTSFPWVWCSWYTWNHGLTLFVVVVPRYENSKVYRNSEVVTLIFLWKMGLLKVCSTFFCKNGSPHPKPEYTVHFSFQKWESNKTINFRMFEWDH